MTIAVILILSGCVGIGICIGFAIGYCRGVQFANDITCDVIRDNTAAMMTVTRAIEKRDEDSEWRGFNRGN